MQAFPALSVRSWQLFAIYAVVPALLLVALVDAFSGGTLARILPRTPDTIFLYGLVFGTPHIVASLFSFADGDYIRFYRRQLSLGIPVFLVAVMALYALSPAWSLIALIAYTEYHAVVQQVGMGRFYFKASLPGFEAWKWTGIALAVIAYGITYKNSLFSSWFAGTLAWPLILVLFVPFLVLTAVMYARVQNRTGRAYVVAFALALLLSIYILYLGYPLLAIFAGRVVHDGPAFLAYIAHDSNRMREGGRNMLYRAFGGLIPIWVAVPALAVGIAYLVAEIPYIAAPILYGVSMLHYYVEGFIWKKGSIHRQYLRFS